MFRIILAKRHKENNPNFHLEGGWRNYKSGISDLSEGDVIVLRETGQYFLVEDKRWMDNIEWVLIRGLSDNPLETGTRYLHPTEMYKLVTQL